MIAFTCPSTMEPWKREQLHARIVSFAGIIEIAVFGKGNAVLDRCNFQDLQDFQQFDSLAL